MKKSTKQAQHTPGPWFSSINNRYIRYEGVRGPNICDLDVFGGPAEEGEANAHLIAAAPDLLRVLQTIVANGVIDIAAARAVIAKAKRHKTSMRQG